MTTTLLDTLTKGPMQAEGVRGAARVTSDAGSFATVAKSDTSDLPGGPTMGLWVGGVGNVAVVGENDPDNTGTIFTAVPAGTRLPIRAKRVLSTGTTATLMVALY